MNTDLGCRTGKCQVDWEMRIQGVWIWGQLLISCANLINLCNFLKLHLCNGNNNILIVWEFSVLVWEEMGSALSRYPVKAPSLSFLIHMMMLIYLNRNTNQWMISWINGSLVKPQQNSKQGVCLDRLWVFTSADAVSSNWVMCICFLFGQESQQLFLGWNKVLQWHMEST